MTDRARKLLTDAMELPLPERAELAADLLASLDGEPEADALLLVRATMTGPGSI